MDKCANCERPIGKLETAHVYRDNVVCGECAIILAGQDAPPRMEYASAVMAPAAPPPPVQQRRGCPICGHPGPPRRKAKGSTLLLIILLLLWIVPGLLYLIFFQGYVYVCPNCGAKLADA